MSYLHKHLTPDKWSKYKESYQILSIGAEIGRAKNLIIINDYKNVVNCYLRALDLLYLTVHDPKWKKKLKELLRLKEYLAETLLFHQNNLNRCLSIYKVLLSFNPETIKVKI